MKKTVQFSDTGGILSAAFTTYYIYIYIYIAFIISLLQYSSLV